MPYIPREEPTWEGTDEGRRPAWSSSLRTKKVPEVLLICNPSKMTRQSIVSVSTHALEALLRFLLMLLKDLSLQKKKKKPKGRTTTLTKDKNENSSRPTMGYKHIK